MENSFIPVENMSIYVTVGRVFTDAILLLGVMGGGGHM